MKPSPGTKRDPGSTQRDERRRVFAAPVVAALTLGLFGLIAAGLASAGPVTAAKPTTAAKSTATAEPTASPESTLAPEPTMSPFVKGRHVYDYGDVLSANSAKTAEALAAHIEAAGGGRVVLFTAATSSNLPDTRILARDWQVDGMLLDGASGSSSNLVLGATLKARLSNAQADAIDRSIGPYTLESWMLISLARVDAFLGGTFVFDGAGALDASGKQRAEAAAKDLSGKIGAPVYIDITLDEDDPSDSAFFSGAGLSSHFHSALIIALGVSDTRIAGYIQSGGGMFDKYNAAAPWKSTSLATQEAANGDVQAALLAAINAVHGGSPGGGVGGISWELVFWIIFTVVVVAIGVGSPFYGAWLIRKLTGVSGPIKGGLPGDAIIESIGETGVTVTMPSVGPNAPEYKLGLQVTPPGGGAPYQVDTKALIPRIFVPMIVPGARVGVLINPNDPQKVTLDLSRMGENAGPGRAAAPPGGFSMDFDESGRPGAGQIAALVGGVRSGSVNSISGSADHLLATGTHGTAVITSAMPLGKTVRDVNPAADPSRLDDPMWVFTVEVTVAGEKPFPAVFGHRVPVAKVASVAPGVKLAVAVDLSDRHNEVAIDWDKSPIGG